MTVRPLLALTLVLFLALPSVGALVPSVMVGTQDRGVYVTMNGEYSSPAGSLFCGGRTFDLTLVMLVTGLRGRAALIADAGDGCREIWPNLVMFGSWSGGWIPDCDASLPPLPCDELTLAPREPGQTITALTFQGANVALRTGTIEVPP